MAHQSGDLNSGMRCIKYFLVVINVLFLTTSLLMMVVGRTVLAIFSEFSEFIDDSFASVSTLLLVSGVVMLGVAAFGVFAAVKESTLLTNIYGGLLLIVFALELSAAVFATLLQGEVANMLMRTMFDTLNAYPTNPYAARAVDMMQDKLQCCGVIVLEDWKGILPIPEDAANTTIMVPPSCCRYAVEDSCDDYIMEGCFRRLEYVVSQSTVVIAMGSISVAFVQILGVVSAFMLAKTIRRTKSLREARRWQLNQSLGIVIADASKVSYNDYSQLKTAAT